MLTFNAGYAASRQCHFSRPSAVRVSGPSRLIRCRRFGPSTLYSHCGGHWSAMLSANCCPFMPGVAAGRAVKVTAGSGGDASPFGPGLSPTPTGERVAGGTDLPINRLDHFFTTICPCQN